MSAEQDKWLEREIDRELKSLPELQAPRTLGPRVMTAIERRANAPWYRQPWLVWPVSARAAALFMLVASFGAVCVMAWHAPHIAGVTEATRQVGTWVSVTGAIWNALSVILGAVVAGLKSLGLGFIAAGLVTVAFGYAVCVGLGTVYVRLAFARS